MEAAIMVEIITIMETIMQAPDQIGGKIKFPFELMLVPFFPLSQERFVLFTHTHTYIYTTNNTKKCLVSNLIDYDKDDYN